MREIISIFLHTSFNLFFYLASHRLSHSWSFLVLILGALIFNIFIYLTTTCYSDEKYSEYSLETSDYSLYLTNISPRINDAKTVLFLHSLTKLISYDQIYDGLAHWGPINSVLLLYDVSYYAKTQRELEKAMEGVCNTSISLLPRQVFLFVFSIAVHSTFTKIVKKI